jgi:hypothetical protein
MIAPINRETSSDELGWGRESPSNAADEGAKVVPGHVGNVSLTGQGGIRNQHVDRRPC